MKHAWFALDARQQLREVGPLVLYRFRGGPGTPPAALVRKAGWRCGPYRLGAWSYLVLLPSGATLEAFLWRHGILWWGRGWTGFGDWFMIGGKIGLAHSLLHLGHRAKDNAANLKILAGVPGRVLVLDGHDRDALLFVLADGDPAIPRVQLVTGAHVWTLLTHARSPARERQWSKEELALMEQEMAAERQHERARWVQLEAAEDAMRAREDLRAPGEMRYHRQQGGTAHDEDRPPGR